jgi:hypothetical protein
MASPLRHLLESRLSELSGEMESLFADARDRARRELAEQLNQAVRRIRLADDREELAATLVDAAAAFASGAAFFHIHDQLAKGDCIRGVSEPSAEAFRALRIPLSSAAALADAVETRDPVVTAAASSQISFELARLLMPLPDARASIFPIVDGDTVPALLYTWGAVQPPAVELLSQVAAAVWSATAPPPPPPEPLVTIAPAPDPASTWDRLSAEDHKVHLRAQRFARVQVAEMRLFDPEIVHTGRARRDLYGALHNRIDAARSAFREQFFANSQTMVDYLHLEIVRTLANDNPDLLGKDYPGPLA